MTTDNSKKYENWTLDGVLSHLQRINRQMPEARFVFILGAGASVSSGIPSGGTLALEWLWQIHKRTCCSDEAHIDQWLSDHPWQEASNLKSIKNAAEHYPHIFQRAFRLYKEQGYAALEAAMEGKRPGLGYSLLAEILQKTRHKIVITTNFDNLVADALLIHGHQSPLVVGHESLAGFVRAQTGRPLVAKIHRDLFLHPINDTEGTSSLHENWQLALKKIFQQCTPIVIGYGGNDGSLMGMLDKLEQGEIAGRMIWCYRTGSALPTSAINVLDKHQGITVEITGFDEFMLALADKLTDQFNVSDIPERTERSGNARADEYRAQIEKIRKNSLRNQSAVIIDKAVQQTLTSKSNWWLWQLKADAEPDLGKRKSIFEKGIKAMPQSIELHSNYANFLFNVRKDFEKAEALYKQALQLDPENARITGNYASFLSVVRKDFDQAEALYKKALQLDPEDAKITSNYVNFLRDVRKDFDQAEALNKKALQLDPEDANIAANLAYLLLCKNDKASLAQAADLVLKVIQLTGLKVTQTLAEALLYGAILHELQPNSAYRTMFARLKGAMAAGFDRGSWDFESMFSLCLPKLSDEKQALYRAIGAAILDESKVSELDKLQLWKAVEMIDPFDALA